jgi:hypothetical protein
MVDGESKMTQEELDALMSGDLDMEDESSDENETQENVDETDSIEVSGSEVKPEELLEEKIKTAELPLPATDENKMVHQLDDVTKESEEKASEIFDIIEGISNDLMEKEESINTIIDVLKSNSELFEKLVSKFPDVATFQRQLDENKRALQEAESALEVLQNSGDSIMNVMDIMQYQDIHRQKIERVINVMRALSKYMSTLFEGKIDDESRVSSATHIHGDKDHDVASNEDIEALLAQFGS